MEKNQIQQPDLHQEPILSNPIFQEGSENNIPPAIPPLQRMANESPQVQAGLQMQRAANNSPQVQEGLARQKAITQRMQEQQASTPQQKSPIIMDAQGVAHESVAPVIEPSFDAVEIGKLDRNKTVWKIAGNEDSQKWKAKKGDAFKVVTGSEKRIEGVDWVQIQIKDPRSQQLVKGWVKQHATENRARPEHTDLDQAIFAEGAMPRPEDVKQHILGDCYLMAALISAAQQRPQAIVDMFSPDPFSATGDTVAVRFFKTVRKGPNNFTFSPSFVTIRKSLVEYAKVSGDGPVPEGRRFAEGPAIWPALIEKAYAAWPERNRVVAESAESVSKYEAINGGHSNHVMMQIFGEAYHKVSLYEEGYDQSVPRGRGDYPLDLIGLYEQIEKGLAEKEVLTLSTDQSWVDTDRENLEPDGPGQSGEAVRGGLAAGHAYGIVGTEESGNLKYVLIRNPWGHTGQKYTKNMRGQINGIKAVKGKKGAVSKIELSDLPRHFSNLGVRTDFWQ